MKNARAFVALQAEHGMLAALKIRLERMPRLKAAVKAAWRAKRYLLRRSEGQKLLLQGYRRIHGKDLKLEGPNTFSEKLYSRMIALNRTGSKHLTALVDKCLVRRYVAEKVGERYLSRVYWHGRVPARIPFDDLPQKYVIKANHGSGQVLRKIGEIDRADTIREIAGWLRYNYYWSQREYQYFGVQPQVMIEEYLDDGSGDGPLDYRFWCFHGRPEVIQVDNHHHDINPFYDINWNLLGLRYRTTVTDAEIEKPANFEEMLSVAGRLSADFDFVRVDLYNVGGRIIFGELTFTPVAGQFSFQPEDWDLKLGEKWRWSDTVP